jgi:hypothetical protein
MPVTANRPCSTLVAPALAAAVAFAAACGEPTDPTNSKSRLQINVATIGVDYDPDGYLLRGVDIEQAVASGPAVTVYRWLWPGSYDVQLDGLAANCNLSGPAVVPVTIVAGQMSSVSFAVECHATTGSLLVATPTRGRDFTTASYAIVVDGAGVHRTGTAYPNISNFINAIPPGTYEVVFQSRAANCQTTGTNPQTATVTAGGLTYQNVSVSFPVECSATTGDVHLVTATTGESVDANGYTVFRDGQEIIVTYCDPFDFYCYYPRRAPLRLDPDAEWSFRAVVPATYSYELRDLAANCVVNGSNPRSVPVTAGDTAEVLFNVACSRVP